ncbi:tubby-like protein 8 isoform X1 [Camellia sinensis]|uniref:tubby-like protein 8 isoform X1 n=1 Tax=Camellia sinensis TaxID=4442 RepID=UPI0010362CA1|nr:tubby-like protein 8 isoform X1 [Camellia sinensis]
MVSDFKNSSIPRQSSYNFLYLNPLTDLKHNRSSSDGGVALGARMCQNPVTVFDDKENAVPNNGFCAVAKQIPNGKAYVRDRALKPSSLQLCMQMNEPDSNFGSKIWDPVGSDNTGSVNIWDYSDSEAAPASSWSTLPNRSLLCRPLPVDIGRCTCVIVKEALPEGLDGGNLYSLYTNEGQGRQDRKLAVAHHRRRNGRSEFVVAQNIKGISCSSDDSLIGIVTANLIGSKYHIWDQGSRINSQSKQSKPPLAVVSFVPTITTWTGSYRSMRVWVPKHQSMQLKNTTQIQHISGLPKDWEGKMDKVHQLFSRIPHYNNISKQYELDFRDRTRAGLRVQSSVKNFQLILEKNGRQTILQLGRVGKSKYVMDYRYPLTAYQAFCISLASINSKLCCAL